LIEKESEWYILLFLLAVIIFREGDKLLLLVLLSLAGHGDSYWTECSLIMRLTVLENKALLSGAREGFCRLDKAQHEIEKLSNAGTEWKRGERGREPGGVGAAKGGRGCAAQRT
jgi:hypothetical protein